MAQKTKFNTIQGQKYYLSRTPANQQKETRNSDIIMIPQTALINRITHGGKNLFACSMLASYADVLWVGHAIFLPPRTSAETNGLFNKTNHSALPDQGNEL